MDADAPSLPSYRGRVEWDDGGAAEYAGVEIFGDFVKCHGDGEFTHDAVGLDDEASVVVWASRYGVARKVAHRLRRGEFATLIVPSFVTITLRMVAGETDDLVPGVFYVDVENGSLARFDAPKGALSVQLESSTFWLEAVPSNKTHGPRRRLVTNEAVATIRVSPQSQSVSGRVLVGNSPLGNGKVIARPIRQLLWAGAMRREVTAPVHSLCGIGPGGSFALFNLAVGKYEVRVMHLDGSVIWQGKIDAPQADRVIRVAEPGAMRIRMTGSRPVPKDTVVTLRSSLTGPALSKGVLGDRDTLIVENPKGSTKWILIDPPQSSKLSPALVPWRKGEQTIDLAEVEAVDVMLPGRVDDENRSLAIWLPADRKNPQLHRSALARIVPVLPHERMTIDLPNSTAILELRRGRRLDALEVVRPAGVSSVRFPDAPSRKVLVRANNWPHEVAGSIRIRSAAAGRAWTEYTSTGRATFLVPSSTGPLTVVAMARDLCCVASGAGPEFELHLEPTVRVRGTIRGVDRGTPVAVTITTADGVWIGRHDVGVSREIRFRSPQSPIVLSAVVRSFDQNMRRTISVDPKDGEVVTIRFD